jgi:hypothetical protein
VTRVVVLGLACLLAACSHGPRWLGGRTAPELGPDSLYWKAVTQLDPGNKRGSIDSAIVYLDAYLVNPRQAHRREALALRQLTRDAKQLARVELALQQARSDTTTHTPRRDGQADPEPPRKRDEEALKEIQRLKEELAKANEELERIRKRLANPKPPTR